LAVQSWLQQSEEDVQAWLSATQLVAVEHTWLVVSHWRLQQSVATAHELPGPLQIDTDDVHFAETGSQTFEQHCPSDVQASPATVHTTFIPPMPGDPEAPAAPVAVVPPPPSRLEPLPPPPQEQPGRPAARSKNIAHSSSRLCPFTGVSFADSWGQPGVAG
jgi:hypothetical protein